MEQELSGILNICKVKGMTSHDVVAAVRRKLGLKKVGHAGTLDPNATGVLVILVGKATKQAGSFLNDTKEYLVEMKLGEQTDTGDADGAVIRTRDVTVGSPAIHEAILSFVGWSEQIPPMFSAKKIGGKPLYKLARKGITVERKPQEIFIENITITETLSPVVRFSCNCSKGTYMRQLVDDIGDKLGCGAHMTNLSRLRSGKFEIKDSIPYSRFLELERETINENILRI